MKPSLRIAGVLDRRTRSAWRTLPCPSHAPEVTRRDHLPIGEAPLRARAPASSVTSPPNNKPRSRQPPLHRRGHAMSPRCLAASREGKPKSEAGSVIGASAEENKQRTGTGAGVTSRATIGHLDACSLGTPWGRKNPTIPNSSASPHRPDRARPLRLPPSPAGDPFPFRLPFFPGPAMP